jgi:hypothetical protein
MPKHSRRGVPDIILVLSGQFVGLEVKTATGRVSPDQLAFEQDCQKYGARYHVVRSIDDVVRLGL